MTGSFHNEARLSPSWNAPMFDAPSPKLVTVTFPSSLTSDAHPRPFAMGMTDPTMPVVTTTPLAGCVMCIGPPFPLNETAIGRPHVGIPVTKSDLAHRLLIEKNNN